MYTSQVALGLSTLFAIISPSLQQASVYTLYDSYLPSNFFTKWNFFTGSDPTHGFVQYLDYPTARSKGLVGVTSAGNAFIGVDRVNVVTNGRPSVRLESTNVYNHGLFIYNLAWMPSSVCGSWPAIWSKGDAPWPTGGEIDVIEGVNQNTQDLMSLHTTPNCTISGTGQSGTTQTYNCDVNAPGQGLNTGCGVLSRYTNSFGSGMDRNPGGTYAMEWTSSYIRIWFFPGSNVPSDITAGTPNPSLWGTPAANFQGNCAIDNFFKDHRLVIDTTFCGDWAGSVWSSGGCQSSTGYSSCANYVGQNPRAFYYTYWAIKSIKVYTKPSITTTTRTSTSTPTTTTTTSVPAKANVVVNNKVVPSATTTAPPASGAVGAGAPQGLAPTPTSA